MLLSVVKLGISALAMPLACKSRWITSFDKSLVTSPFQSGHCLSVVATKHNNKPAYKSWKGKFNSDFSSSTVGDPRRACTSLLAPDIWFLIKSSCISVVTKVAVVAVVVVVVAAEVVIIV
jgi:hypothetical protein